MLEWNGVTQLERSSIDLRYKKSDVNVIKVCQLPRLTDGQPSDNPQLPPSTSTHGVTDVVLKTSHSLVTYTF